MTMRQAAHAAEATPARAGGRRLLPIFAGLLIAMFLAALDQTIFSTALPTIVGDLHGVDQMLWVTTSYLLASTIMMPIYGKLGDLVGRKPLLIGALSIFVAGSLIGALAQNMTVLIIGRTVQGVGGGGLMLLAQAIIADVVPARERGRYMGVMGAVFGLSSVLGPLLGGWFTESLSWRYGFWLNVPLGVIAILAAVLFLKLPRHDQRPSIDVLGIFTMAIAVSALILATSWGGNKYDWDSWQILGLFGITVVVGAVFVIIERYAKEPILPPHLFRQRNFNLTTIASLIIAIAMFGAIGYMPTYLQMSTGVSATESGLMLLPMVVGLLIASITSGQIVSRTGRYKWAPILSMIVAAGGVLLLSTLTADTDTWVILTYLFVLGAGIGIGMQNLILIVQNTFRAQEVGTATAASNFFRQIGASLGSAVVGSVFTSRLTDLLTDRLPAQAMRGAGGGDANSLTPELVDKLPQRIQDIIVGAYNDALTPIFLYLAPLLGVALILMLFIREKALATTIEGSGATLDVHEPDPTRAGGAARGGALSPDRRNALVTGLVLALITTHWTTSRQPDDALTALLSRLSADQPGSSADRARHTVIHLLRPAAIGLLTYAVNGATAPAESRATNAAAPETIDGYHAATTARPHPLDDRSARR